MTENSKEAGKGMARVIAKAWTDEGFKKRLMSDPTAVLSEEGVMVPEGIDLRIIEDEPGRKTMVLPPAPNDAAGIEDLEERFEATFFWPFNPSQPT